jgi:anti-sigma regulatory factor (Ser/Thr protein kinase)
MKTSRSFTADPGSTRSARHFVLQAAGNASPDLRDAIAVMVGELAMNAVQHARTDFEITVELTDGTLRVQVTDSAGNRPAAGPMPPPATSRGRGLPIVASLADDWGVIPSPAGPGKSIWFKIAVPSPARPGQAAQVQPMGGYLGGPAGPGDPAGIGVARALGPYPGHPGSYRDVGPL